MESSVLMAISPLDGRYHEKTQQLAEVFSEYGLIKFRLIVEIRWLEMLTELQQLPDVAPLSNHAKKILDDIITNFSVQDAARVKHIETGINHDVKAVEYFLKERITGNQELANVSELIHFGCTSEDINNLAYSMMLVDARAQCILPALDHLMLVMKKMAQEYADVSMLSHTHGQPATPTTVGKEIANVIARLKRQIDQLTTLLLFGKMNGASGNYNAMVVAYPDVDWQIISKNFVSRLGLQWNPYTTQIEPHDSMCEMFAILIRINNILIDFNRDMWGYIALNYFSQKSVANEVGSSTMPHKINPIDFENAEGNLGIANALFSHMIEKLPISRWQRDLSDSTVLRNIGVAIGHAILAYQSCEKGLNKVTPNLTMIQNDLDQHWEVLAEAIQMVMRRYHLEQPYEKLKAFTRGKQMNQALLQEFIAQLDLPKQALAELLALTPASYTGLAKELACRI